MKRRSRFEVYLDLLKAVRETSKPTHIGNMTNLSWKDTMKHLKFLEQEGFVKAIKKPNGRAEYKLTPRGLEALESLERVTEALTPSVETAR
ncbi:MAG: winged helix-turn-helix domain-containing protein [Nitrososphaerota archaeon]|nr:hypothetical protein [Candidatus Bathyarchaeota archaeon]MDW8048375.1 winged helix-turn-helix domain-containing protein [Nitrososphaerota archaeon]